MGNTTGKKKITVVGDSTVDWHFAIIRESTDRFPFVDVEPQPGGAALLSNLLQSMPNLQDVEINANSVEMEGITMHSKKHLHSYNFFKLFENNDKNAPSEEKGKKDRWRISEFHGYNMDPSKRNNACAPLLDGIIAKAEGTNVLVLDDANFNFRNCTIEKLVSACGEKNLQQIVIKTVSPVLDGEIWEALKMHKEKLILIISAEELRRGSVRGDGSKRNGMLITRAISWERTCRDIAWELDHSLEFHELGGLAHIFVLFPNDGAVYRSYKINGDTPPCKMQLIFDPHVLEGQWEGQYKGKGQMMGYGSVFTAAVVSELIAPQKPDLITASNFTASVVSKPIASQEPDLIKASKVGLNAMRYLLRIGYESIQSAETDTAALQFPYSKFAEWWKSESENVKDFGNVEITTPHNASDKTDQTILKSTQTDLLELARNIVRKGIDEAVENVPVCTFGKLKTLDRHEIEYYNSVRNLIAEYVGGSSAKPLCIAVFGQPGSGKSFSVQQISKSLPDGNRIEDVSFNLSQFTSVNNLISAFHRIRDIALQGKIPLVFWDEFDSSFDEQPLYWLKFFLSPMQDGCFTENESVHWIGKSILVFAGGTKFTFKEFSSQADSDKDHFKAVKGPDFVSRLVGFLDILGINPREESPGGSDPADKSHYIRRAIALCSKFPEKLRKDGELRIDPRVLNAFLETKKYHNGIRSMEAVIKMSRLNDGDEFNRSALPTASQLDAHVNAVDFMQIVHRLEGEALLKLAEAVHEVYRTHKMKQKKSKEIITRNNREELIKECLVSYKELNRSDQESNQALARSIPGKLEEVGYVMMPAKEGQNPFNIPPEVLEQMAVREHDRWWKEREASGWKYGPVTDKPNKIHNCLVPWDKLKKPTKEYDRVLSKGIPKMLSKLGYTVYKSGNLG